MTEIDVMNIKISSCGQPSNLSSDFPLGSRKFISELVY